MITTLTITNNAMDSIYKKITYLIKPNLPEYRVVSYNNIDVMQIIYNYRNKKIPWKKISHLINDNNGFVLCREDINIPPSVGIKRYSSDLLTKQMCKNAAIKYIKVNNYDPKKLKILIFDKDAKYIDILEDIIMLTNDIRIVTDFPKLYYKKANQLRDDYGASIVVSDNLTNFESCADILISPDKIIKKLNLKNSAVVFTSKKPSVNLNAKVYYSYKVKLPKKVMNIIPADLEPEYFLSALYDNYKIYSLSSIVPSYCISDESVVSIL